MSASPTRYRRARELLVEIDATGTVLLNTPEGAVTCGRHGLAILDAFSELVSIEDAVAALSDRAVGREDWIDLTGIVMQLVRRGILIAEADSRTPVTRGGRTYPTEIHVSMLEDEPRTSGFLAAVRQSVAPGDVVLEIGSGSGILAVAAAMAGARHVYAVEASVGDWTRAVAAANGVADRVTVIDGWSNAVELPERADILVSETVGNDALEEGVLAFVLDARARMLKPDARIIPRRIEIFAVPVEMPTGQRANRAFESERVDGWRARYGVDLSRLVDLTAENRSLALLSAPDARTLRALAPRAVVADVDFATVRSPSLVTTTATEVDTAGRVDGAISWFALDLAPGCRLERPWDSQDTAHSSWGYPVWLRPPLVVEPGDRLELTYKHRIANVPRHELLTIERA